MANPLSKNATPVRGGLDMLRSHCETLNSYNWVRASGKRYVIAKGEDGKHYLDFRLVKDA
jgi:hypothetical protein